MRAGPKAEPASNQATEAHAAQLAAVEHDQRQAARVVASRATDRDDCCQLLAMLGLNNAVGLPVIDPPPRH